jgi:hypothetical protein
MTYEEAELEIGFRLPLAVRVIVTAAAVFSFAFVVADLDRLYEPSRV